MRVLHSAALLRPALGIVNQMKWEQAASAELGLDWDARMFCPMDSIAPSTAIQFSNSVHADCLQGTANATGWWKLRQEYHAWLNEQQANYDVLLLRYYPHDLIQMKFVRAACKPVFLVHHTLEEPELAGNGSLVGRMRAVFDGLVAPRTIKAAAGVIGVTEEIVAYELKRAKVVRKLARVYPNGVIYQNLALPDERGEVPELLFVASSFAPWHGLDLLLESVGRSRENFVLHLVGNVSDADKRVAQADSRVRLHGRLNQVQIATLAARCTLGLSSLALFRQKMTEACTLKVREYLMLGLPVYAGYRDVFTNTFPYYQQGPSDLGKILEFAATHAKTPRESVAAEARPYIEKRELLRHLHQWLLDECARHA